MVKIDPYPKLVKWLKDNHYFQTYVRVNHVPDVVETTYRPRLSLHNIEQEMKKLQESINNCTGLLADEDRPDYGVA